MKTKPFEDYILDKGTYYFADGVSGGGGGSPRKKKKKSKKQKEKKMKEGKPKPLASQGKVVVKSKPVYIGIGLKGENLKYYGLGEKFSDLVASKLDEQDALKDFAKYGDIMGKCLLGWYNDSFGMEITFESKLISKFTEIYSKVSNEDSLESCLFSGKHKEKAGEIASFLEETGKSSFSDFKNLTQPLYVKVGDLKLASEDGEVYYFHSSYNAIINFTKERLEKIPMDAYVFNLHQTNIKYVLEKLTELGYVKKTSKDGKAVFDPVLKSDLFTEAFGMMVRFYEKNEIKDGRNSFKITNKHTD